MTQEDFVSLECAKLLKEKGFDEPCLAYYLGSEFNWTYSEEPCQNMNEIALNFDAEGFCNAPTLYEAAKWLRQRYLINIIVCCSWGKKDKYSYAMNINQDDCNVDMKCKDQYPTYESALDAGIIEALNLIKIQ